jgi:putative thioredoxin
MTLIGETAAAGPGDLIKDGTDASFAKDVIDASRDGPVIVDFWATWCGPCKTLGPALERAVIAAKGAVKLVKIDIDKNPVYAGQLRVQSIPTVYAFLDGKPFDGFMGAVPESQLKAFIDRLVQAAGPGPEGAQIDELVAMGKESLQLGDMGGAAQAFAQALQLEPDNVAAIAGLAKVYLAGGDPERAAEVAAMAPPDARDADLESVRAALRLAQAAPSEVREYEERLARDPADHAARLELAKALAGGGNFQAAADELLTIIEADREWNEGAARKQLLEVFDAAGPASDVARLGRRRLSSILFS